MVKGSFYRWVVVALFGCAVLLSPVLASATSTADCGESGGGSGGGGGTGISMPTGCTGISMPTLQPATSSQITDENHSWNGYPWARTVNSFNLRVGDNVGSAWDIILVIWASM